MAGSRWHLYVSVDASLAERDARECGSVRGIEQRSLMTWVCRACAVSQFCGLSVDI